MSPDTAANQKKDARRPRLIWAIVFRHGWVLVIGCLLGAAAGYGWGLKAPVSYDASTTLLINPQVASINAEQAGVLFTTKTPSVASLKAAADFPSILLAVDRGVGEPFEGDLALINSKLVFRSLGEAMIQLQATAQTAEQSLSLVDVWTQKLAQFTEQNWATYTDQVVKLTERHAQLTRELEPLLSISEPETSTILMIRDLESRIRGLAEWAEVWRQVAPTGPVLQVVEPARLPSQPSKNAIYQRWLAATVAGCLLGVAVCVLRGGGRVRGD